MVALVETLLYCRRVGCPAVDFDGAGDDFSTDPLLAYRPDLARYTRLGDLLLQAGRPKAALVEYGKAVDPDSPASPLLFSRRAQCHAELMSPVRRSTRPVKGTTLSGICTASCSAWAVTTAGRSGS